MGGALENMNHFLSGMMRPPRMREIDDDRAVEHNVLVSHPFRNLFVFKAIVYVTYLHNH